MMKLGGKCIVQKSRPSSNVGVIVPLGAHPQNVALSYDVGKIRAGCVVEYATSPWASSATEVAKETKFGTKVACGVRMMPKHRIHP